MQRPRHIREGSKAKLKAVVSANKELKALGLMPVSKGFRLSPDMRNGYVFTNPSNLGRRSNAGMDGTTWGYGGKHWKAKNK